MVRRLAELFRATEDEVARGAAAPDAVRRYWFPGSGVRWGISPEQQQAFLRWAEGIVT